MEQFGHADPVFTLRLYTHVMLPRRRERDRLRALVRGCSFAAIAGVCGEVANESAYPGRATRLVSSSCK